MTDATNASVNLKHRLVGGVALVLLAIVLLPRVLTGTGSPGNSLNADYTEDETRVRPTVISEISTTATMLLDSSKNTEIEVLEGLEDSELITIPSPDKRGLEKDILLLKDEVDAIADLTLDLDSRAVVTGWIAQVGIFRKSDNVSRVLADLRNDGMYPKLKSVDANGSEATLIWIGPYITKEEARREGSKAMLRTDSSPVVRAWPNDL